MYLRSVYLWLFGVFVLGLGVGLLFGFYAFSHENNGTAVSVVDGDAIQLATSTIHRPSYVEKDTDSSKISRSCTPLSDETRVFSSPSEHARDERPAFAQLQQANFSAVFKEYSGAFALADLYDGRGRIYSNVYVLLSEWRCASGPGVARYYSRSLGGTVSLPAEYFVVFSSNAEHDGQHFKVLHYSKLQESDHVLLRSPVPVFVVESMPFKRGDAHYFTLGYPIAFGHSLDQVPAQPHIFI